MASLARVLMIMGVVVFVLGALLFLAARSGLPLGRLPGDIRIQSGNMTCLFPLATSILLSILLTILVNIIARFLK